MSATLPDTAESYFAQADTEVLCYFNREPDTRREFGGPFYRAVLKDRATGLYVSRAKRGDEVFAVAEGASAMKASGALMDELIRMRNAGAFALVAERAPWMEGVEVGV